jgi:hypothetical protein
MPTMKRRSQELNELARFKQPPELLTPEQTEAILDRAENNGKEAWAVQFGPSQFGCLMGTFEEAKKAIDQLPNK